MEALREGLAMGLAPCPLRAEPHAGPAGSLGVIYRHGGVLRPPSPAGSVLRRRVGSCRREEREGTGVGCGARWGP